MIFNWKDKDLYVQLYKEQEYGYGGGRHFELIDSIADTFKVKSIFDFGCGKRKLLNSLEATRKYTRCGGYEPAFDKECDDLYYDMVVSTDVLEHLHESELYLAFEIFKSKQPTVMFHRICGRVASTILPDGSNAHKTVEDYYWWQNILSENFQQFTLYGQICPDEMKIFSFLMFKED